MDDEKEKHFKVIYNQFGKGVFQFIYFKVSDYELAKDLTEETFIRFWKTMQRAKEIHKPSSLVFLIARGIVIDHYRTKRNIAISLDAVDERLLAQLDDTEEQLDKRQILNDIFGKLKTINKDYQEVLVLYYVEELKVSEIAVIINKKENAIRVLLHRAVSALKEKYE